MNNINKKILCTAAAMLISVNSVFAAGIQKTNSDAISAFEQVTGYAAELYIDSSVTQDDIIIGAAKKFPEEYPELAEKYPSLKGAENKSADDVKKIISEIIGDDEEMLVRFFKCAMRSLDKYSDFLTLDEYQVFASDLNQQFYGIGVIIRQESFGVQVQGFTDNSAAQEAGVLEGDIFKKVDGEDVSEMSLQQVRAKIMGELGKPVKVTFARGDGEYTVTINRCEVRGDTVTYEIIDDKVGYIRVTDMADETDNEFWVALEEMKIAGITDIIIDLRYNGGGYLNTAVDFAREIVPFGLVCSTRYRATNDRVTNYYSHLEEKTDFDIKVLVNDSTASAAEIVASAIQESDTGMLYGQKTYGKGVIQTTYELANGSIMKITTGEYMTRDGNKLNGIGIEPDVVIENELVKIDLSEYSGFDFETEWQIGMTGEGVASAKEKLCLLGYYDGLLNDTYEAGFATGVKQFRADNNAGDSDVIDVELQRLIDEKFSELDMYEDTQLESVIELFKYDDIDDFTWAHKAIAAMSFDGVVKGMGEGEFSPDMSVTRAEFAAMLVRAFDIQADGHNSFPDVPSDAWYCDSIVKAVGAGLINGDENGYFNPDDNISRQDMALLLQRAAEYAGIDIGVGAAEPFYDWNNVEDYAKLAVTKISAAGIMTGTDTKHFSPTENATRAQSVVVLDRLLDKK